MSIPMDSPNPLRPYYVPPSVGFAPDVPLKTSAAIIGGRKASTTTTSFGSSARNILADMDYSEYLLDSSPSSGAVLKNLLEQAVWKYTSIFLAQPFDVAKTVLQVHGGSTRQKGLGKSSSVRNIRQRPRSLGRESYETPSDDSDPESPSYFTPAAPLSHTISRSTRARRRRESLESPSRSYVHSPQSPSPNHTSSSHILSLKSSSSLLSVLSQLWATEGSWGIWKGTNVTYVYSLLFSTITSFTRSFLSALLALPDPSLSFQLASSFTYAGGLDILSSPSPLASLFVAVSSAGIAGIALAPLDIVRTRLILTPSTHPPRSILLALKSLSSLVVPLSIAPATILNSTLPTLISASTPLLLRSKLGIDPVLTPNWYTIATFAGQTLELGLKLPVETILKRGQMKIVQSESNMQNLPTVVEIGAYSGLFGTVRSIIYEEGDREVPVEAIKPEGGVKSSRAEKAAQQRRRRRGQGFEGLWRGWRVGMWGLVGVWGAATLGGVGKGGEF